MKRAFGELLEDQTKLGTKLQTDEYHDYGSHIIVDQGQEQIAGYTDMEEGIFTDVPAIIFGDHTRIIKYVDEPFFLGADGVKVLRCKLPDANYRYLYYALRHVRIPNTGYNRHFKWLKEAQIEYPDDAKQAEIVAILDTIYGMISKWQRQLRAFDTLIKARFVEMFGDPIFNPFGWKQVTLKDVAVGKLSYGSGASAVEYNGQIRYIRITDITDNGNLNDEKKSPDDYDEKYLLHNGDILFARSGATVGKTFCYNESKHGDAIYAGYLIRMIPDPSKVLPAYVFHYTKTEYYAAFVANAQRAVAQPNINAQEYGDLIICVPPLELQKQFANFVSQIDKSKSVIQQALAKDQLLFDSLMQKYFG